MWGDSAMWGDSGRGSGTSMVSVTGAASLIEDISIAIHGEN
jgi:hypothetical protein